MPHVVSPIDLPKPMCFNDSIWEGLTYKDYDAITINAFADFNKTSSAEVVDYSLYYIYNN